MLDVTNWEYDERLNPPYGYPVLKSPDDGSKYIIKHHTENALENDVIVSNIAKLAHFDAVENSFVNYNCQKLVATKVLPYPIAPLFRRLNIGEKLNTLIARMNPRVLFLLNEDLFPERTKDRIIEEIMFRAVIGDGDHYHNIHYRTDKDEIELSTSLDFGSAFSNSGNLSFPTQKNHVHLQEIKVLAPNVAEKFFDEFSFDTTKLDNTNEKKKQYFKTNLDVMKDTYRSI